MSDTTAGKKAGGRRPRPVEPEADASSEPVQLQQAGRTYVLLCLASLVVMVLALVERGLLFWALFPALVGSCALALRWRMAVPMLLVTLGGLLFIDSYHEMGTSAWRGRLALPVSNLLVCGSVLVYAASCYRLLGLTQSIFTPDPREVEGEVPVRALIEGASGSAHRRDQALVGASEVSVQLLTLPVWVGLGHLVWFWLADERAPLDMLDELWQWMLLFWLFSLAALIVAAALGYLRQVLMTPQQATLYLQDVQWLQTRHEQRLINRWLVWARLRRKRREP